MVTYSEKQIESEIQAYKNAHPNEDLPIFTIELSGNFKDDVVRACREFKYAEDYISKNVVDVMSSHGYCYGVTLFETMGAPARIVIDKNMPTEYITAMIHHELTHVSDYFSYCKNHNKLSISHYEFKHLPENFSIYFLSEFRAFYREGLSNTLIPSERIKQWSKLGFERELIKLMKQGNFSRFHYYITQHIADILVSTPQSTTAFFPTPLQNLGVFLANLVPKNFSQLEPHFQAFLDLFAQVAYSFYLMERG